MKTQKLFNILAITALLSIVSLPAILPNQLTTEIPAKSDYDLLDDLEFNGISWSDRQGYTFIQQRGEHKGTTTITFFIQNIGDADKEFKINLDSITARSSSYMFSISRYALTGTTITVDAQPVECYAKSDPTGSTGELASFTFESGHVLTNNSYVSEYNIPSLSLYDAAGLIVDLDIYNSSYTYSKTAISYFRTRMYYSFHPIIVIDSDYFNLQNTYCKIYDRVSCEWIEMPYDTVQLQHYKYKTRIYSKEDNTLLFEDTEFQQFSVYREIDISSMRYVNNAPEPVNISLYQNESIDCGTAENDIFSSYDYKMSDVEQSILKTGVKPITYFTYVEYLLNDISIADIDGHKNVLNITQGNATSGYGSVAAATIDNEEAGTIELFFRYASAHNYYLLVRDGATNGAYLNILNNELRFYNGTFNKIADLSQNTWYHIGIDFDCSTDKYDVYLNSVKIGNQCEFQNLITKATSFRMSMQQTSNGGFAVDALSYEWDGYTLGDNQLIAGFMNKAGTDCSISVQDAEIENMLTLNDASATYTARAYYSFSSQTSGAIDLYFNTDNADQLSYVFLIYGSSTTGVNVNVDNFYFRAYNGTTTNIVACNSDQFYHLRLEFECGSGNYSGLAPDTYYLYVNEVQYGPYNFQQASTSLQRIDFQTYTTHTNYYYQIGAIRFGWDDPLYKYPVKTTFVNSYSVKYEFHEPLDYLYQVSDRYGNILENSSIQSTENEIIYTPAEMEDNFIKLEDQQGNYLDWENYKLYVNNTLLYSNLFYREIGTLCNVSIYDTFDNLQASTLHTVERDVNYINLTITLYSLKIYNQQQLFLHLNITQESTEFYWSTFIGPTQTVEYRLVPDTYNITITEYEGGETETVYELNFADDDILLISSANTLGAVIQSFENLNTTLDEQFTYVSLNFTNIDSSIGNQTTIIEINFSNINSSLDDIFISQQNSLLFLNASMESVIYSLENSFDFLNTTVNSIYQINENSFTFLNSTTNELLVYSANSFEFMNSSLNSITAMSLSSFNYLNTTIENSVVYMAQNFTFLNSKIDTNQLEVVTSFAIINSNITNNSANIVSNILAVNSTMSNLILDLTSSVLVVNDTIYSAVLNSTSVLSLQNNQILGNLSITYQQNEFLTDILKNTMFSELLNWTGVGYDYSLIENQIKTVQAVNNMRNETLGLFFKYQDEIDSMLLSYGSPIDIQLPANLTDYRIYSYETEEYLTEWEEIPDDGYINFGYYEREEPIVLSGISAADYIISGIIFIAITVFIMQAGIKNKTKPKLIRSDTYHLKNQGKKSSTQTNDPMNALRRHF